VKKNQIPVTQTALLVEALTVQVMTAGVLKVVAMDHLAVMAVVMAMAVEVVTAVAMAMAVAMAVVVDTTANAAVTVVVMVRARLRIPEFRFQLTSTWCANAFGG
jgi:hypothetical protein